MVNRHVKGERLWNDIGTHYRNAENDFRGKIGKRDNYEEKPICSYFTEKNQLELLVKKAQSRIRQLVKEEKI